MAKAEEFLGWSIDLAEFKGRRHKSLTATLLPTYSSLNAMWISQKTTQSIFCGLTTHLRDLVEAVLFFRPETFSHFVCRIIILCKMMWITSTPCLRFYDHHCHRRGHSGPLIIGQHTITLRLVSEETNRTSSLQSATRTPTSCVFFDL